MKITKSDQENVRLFSENMIKEQLIKKAYNHMPWLRKQQKILKIELLTLKN